MVSGLARVIEGRISVYKYLNIVIIQRINCITNRKLTSCYNIKIHGCVNDIG